MAKEKKPWAPRTNSGKIGNKETTDGNSVSFEAYFLRDLYSQGKIDDKLIKEIIEVEKLNVKPEDVIEIISNTSGAGFPRGLVDPIRNLAQIVVERN
jgi:hypothetical protein